MPEDDLVSLIEKQIYETLYLRLGRKPYVSGGRWHIEINCNLDENDAARVAEDIYDLLHGRGAI